MTYFTDSPDADAPDAVDNDSDDFPDADDNDASYPKLIHLSLPNSNSQNRPQHQKKNDHQN